MMGAETIIARIGSALEKARWRGLELRGLYLDHADYADFAYAETVSYQKRTGSTAMLWPIAYDNVLIIGAKLIPVKESGASAIYATSGEAIYIPKRLSVRTRAAA